MEGRGPVARTRYGKAGSGLRAGTRLTQALQHVRAKTRHDRDQSRMRKSRASGSVRGVRRKAHPYSTRAYSTLQYKTLVSRPRRDDGRTRGLRRAEHHSALGPALRSRLQTSRSAGIVSHARSAARGADETYTKVRGRWVYLYRTVDARGNTVDFRLSRKRDVPAAKAFFARPSRLKDRCRARSPSTDTRPPIGPFTSFGPRIEN